MKISNNSQYDSIKLLSQRPQDRAGKSSQASNHETEDIASRPYNDLKTLNIQVAQVQELEKNLGDVKKKYDELQLFMEKDRSPEVEKKIYKIELKIAEILRKSMAQSQEFEFLPSLYRSLLQSCKTKDYDKIEDLLSQTQNRLHYLLEKFENEILDAFPHDEIDFDPKRINNNLLIQSHNPQKLSSKCLV